jgi:hypothetical protein
VKRLGTQYRVTRPDLFRYLGLPPELTARPESDPVPAALLLPAIASDRDSMIAVYHAAIMAAARVIAGHAATP